MACAVEFLMPPQFRLGRPMLEALLEAARAAGHRTVRTVRYEGAADWLVLYGVGAQEQSAARAKHRAKGRQVVLWDLGYFGRRDANGHLRFSLNRDHPQDLLDGAPEDGARWAEHGLALREDYDPDGPIILVGLGPKSRRYLGLPQWEAQKLDEIRQRFPGRRVIYRPKPKRAHARLPCETDERSPIAQLLRGASLVVCRHSNVAVDAAIAGVPFECEDGASRWLQGKPFTPEARLEFLRRLAWFQWRPDEAEQAWQFVSDLASRGTA